MRFIAGDCQDDNPTWGSLIASSNTLYGVAPFRGTSDEGVIFSLAVPEPTSLSLLALVIPALLTRHRRTRAQRLAVISAARLGTDDPARLPRGISTPLLAAVISLLVAVHSAPAINYTAHDLYNLTSPAGLQYPGSATDGTNGVQSAAGGQVGGYGVTIAVGFAVHAVYWTSAGTPVDLNPSGFVESEVYATDGANQVGGVPNDGRGFTAHALLWAGTAASAVDLNPVGDASSIAFGVYGNQQVGRAAVTSGGSTHAMLWTGTAASAVDLNPTNLPNITSSTAYATDGTQQVGQGNNDAILWTGTAASAVDLMPPGFSNTFAIGLVPNQQVGFGHNNQTASFNAILWSGSAASFVDLNGPGYVDTYAVDTNGVHQVGFGFNQSTNEDVALLWSGSAGSVVNLGSLLPPGFKNSEALTIDASGDVWGFAINPSGTEDAIEWVPQSVPEPCGLLTLGLGTVVFVNRRRRNE
jgi:hypothetical protein